MKKFELEKVLTLLVAVIALAYLVYVLVWRGDELSHLHIFIFLFVVILILAPFVTRLRIPNVLEFDKKIDDLREETKRDLANIHNEIKTTIQAH